ncbi:hypothetical protein GIB67_010711, partial [Kingdonia uniflora]
MDIVYARAFIAYMMGNLFFSNGTTSLRTGYLAALTDYDILGALGFNWGTPIMAALYRGLDEVSVLRNGKVKKSFTGFYSVLELWFFEYCRVGIYLVKVQNFNHIYPRISGWRDERASTGSKIYHYFVVIRDMIEWKDRTNIDWQPWHKSRQLIRPEVRVDLALNFQRVLLVSVPYGHGMLWYLGDRCMCQMTGRDSMPYDPSQGDYGIPKSLGIDIEGCCQLQAQAALGAQAESVQAVNIPQDSKFETEYAQATLGAQPPLPNVSPDSDVNIHIIRGRSFPFLFTITSLYGDATVIGGTWGFLTIMEVFENNLLQDLNAFKSLKAGGAGNSLSMRKLKEHYTYKLEMVLSDGTAAAAKKKKGLITRSVARAYMLYVIGPFLFPMKNGINVSARYLYLFANDKVAKKWPWGSAVLAHMYYNLGAASRDDGRQFAYCTTLLKLAGIPKEMDSDAYEHCTYWKWDVSLMDRYGGTTLLKFREALNNYKLEDVSSLPCYTVSYYTWNNDVGIHQRKEASVNEYGDTPVYQYEDVAEQYDASCKESESLKAVNAFFIEQIDLQLTPATPLPMLQSFQPVSDATLAKKYEDLLAAHEDVTKKLIAKEDF